MGTHRGVTSEPGFTQEPLLLLSALGPLPQGAEERGPGLFQPPLPRTIEMRPCMDHIGVNLTSEPTHRVLGSASGPSSWAISGKSLAFLGLSFHICQGTGKHSPRFRFSTVSFKR